MWHRQDVWKMEYRDVERSSIYTQPLVQDLAFPVPRFPVEIAAGQRTADKTSRQVACRAAAARVSRL